MFHVCTAFGGAMFRNILFFVMLFLTSSNVISSWGAGEPADEVIEMIETTIKGQPKNDAVEKSARIAAARRAAALKKAVEKAEAEQKERERLDLKKAEEDKRASEEKMKSEMLTAEKARSVAGQEQKAVSPVQDVASSPGSPTGSSPQVPAQVGPAAALSDEREGRPEVVHENSWWGSFSTAIGFDDDPGVTVKPVSGANEPLVSDYIIGPGDLIGVSVWRDENLSKTVVVLPDGKISFPLLGELVAAGKTVATLKQELETALSRYTADSTVTVEVKQSNSMVIYVTGRVNSPGRQLLVASTNVLQALSMAGGPNPFAQKSKIKVFRQQGGETVMFPFNYNEVMEGRHLETNIELKRGDVIIVP